VIGPISEGELAGLPAKAKKHPAVVRMYREHDFLTAYAKHTDWRVGVNGYKGAIGSVDDWERHGQLQFEFLRSQGLRTHHHLLDLGCGTGRLARKVVPYLEYQHYTGVDISSRALDSANELASREGWASRKPEFTMVIDSLRQFDFIWAFSVFIHLPADLMAETMYEVAKTMNGESRFLWSYVPEKIDARTGLKQFRHTLATYQRAAESAGLTFADVPEWNGEQRIALSVLR
jgi:SAM-dependent methyltransferase